MEIFVWPKIIATTLIYDFLICEKNCKGLHRGGLILQPGNLCEGCVLLPSAKFTFNRVSEQKTGKKNSFNTEFQLTHLL